MFTTLLENLLFNNDISPTLIRLWSQNNNVEGKSWGILDWISRRRVLAVFLCLSVLSGLWFGLVIFNCLLSSYQTQDNYNVTWGAKISFWGAFVALAVSVCVSLAVRFKIRTYRKEEKAMGKPLPDTMFIKDLEALINLLHRKNSIGFMSEEDLRKSATEWLTKAALIVLEREDIRGPKSPVTKEVREQFRVSFNIAQKFDLDEGKHDPYYKAAQETMKARAESPGRERPIGMM